MSDDAQSFPHEARNLPPRRPRLTFGGLILLIGVLSILAGLSLPFFAELLERRRAAFCLNNLKQIGLAMRLYSGDCTEAFPCDSKATTLGSFALLTNNYQTSYATWVCPNDVGVTPGSPNTPFTSAHLSYAYGAFGMAETTQPDTPLACDRSSGDIRSATPYATNRWTHRSIGGNVLFADGHVAFQKKFVPPLYNAKNP